MSFLEKKIWKIKYETTNDQSECNLEIDRKILELQEGEKDFQFDFNILTGSDPIRKWEIPDKIKNSWKMIISENKIELFNENCDAEINALNFMEKLIHKLRRWIIHRG